MFSTNYLPIRVNLSPIDKWRSTVSLSTCFHKFVVISTKGRDLKACGKACKISLFVRNDNISAEILIRHRIYERMYLVKLPTSDDDRMLFFLSFPAPCMAGFCRLRQLLCFLGFIRCFRYLCFLLFVLFANLFFP